ncbi:MAG: DUF3857 domain-containing protein [Opitutaceae bacterium]|jgi:transglutaminase-like putative cysteine protease|nr:DUF3857 domain-containing protein [Opitutaceae bacterium]
MSASSTLLPEKTGPSAPGSGNNIRGLIDEARNRIRIGPLPDWIMPPVTDIETGARAGDAATWLLIDRQEHAVHSRSFIHTVVRLENMQAVQHHSQWRLTLDPRTEHITLHSVCIRRGEQVFEHARLDNIHLLQREESLEHFMLHGCFTLLIVLEDVRPGDIIESSCTIERHPRVLSGYTATVFSLPLDAVTGRYRFSVTLPAGRPLRWKTVPAGLEPVRTPAPGTAGLARWTWNSDERTVTEAGEPAAPEWNIIAPWIQVSDCPDWGAIARSLHQAWPEAPEDAAAAPALGKLMAEIEAAGPGIAARTEKAIRLVQDEHRYLSVGTELGGFVPVPPETTARRRFGDCKDLTLLLVVLLRRLGLAARPVLVSPGLGNALSGLLPSPYLFGHVIVELTFDGNTRWIDPTLSWQGGGPAGRSLPDHVAGLPIDPDATGLIAPPEGNTARAGEYCQRETILPDTTGSPSLVEVVTQATGMHADRLRSQLAHAGPDALARDRLEAFAHRFGEAKRIAAIALRDDRETNEFVIVDAYEAPKLVHIDHTARTSQLLIPPSLIQEALVYPGPDRKQPVRLPFPLRITQIRHICATALPRQGHGREHLETPSLRLNVERSVSPGTWSITVSLETLRDHVAAVDLASHRQLLERFAKATNWSITRPSGCPRRRRPPGFGQLPTSRAAATGEQATPAIVPMATDAAGLKRGVSSSASGRRRKNQGNADAANDGRSFRRRRRRRSRSTTLAVSGAGIVLFLLIVMARFLLSVLAN